MFNKRYPKTPWLYDFKDLIPQGDPETVVFLPKGESLLGLYIKGLEGDTVIGIRCDELGRPETCAVTNEIHVDISVQSNPRRWAEQGDDA